MIDNIIVGIRIMKSFEPSARIAGTFTDGCIGIYAVEKSLYGDALRELSKVQKRVRTAR